MKKVRLRYTVRIRYKMNINVIYNTYIIYYVPFFIADSIYSSWPTRYASAPRRPPPPPPRHLSPRSCPVEAPTSSSPASETGFGLCLFPSSCSWWRPARSWRTCSASSSISSWHGSGSSRASGWCPHYLIPERLTGPAPGPKPKWL